MVEKVIRTKLALEPGYLYFVDDEGDVSRKRRMAMRCQETEIEKVATVGVEQAPGYVYFIDRQGGISRVTDGSESEMDPQIYLGEGCLFHDGQSYFEPEENRSWAASIGDEPPNLRKTLRAGLGQDMMITTVPEEFALGDWLLLFANEQDPRLIGLAQLFYRDVEPDDGGFFCWLQYFSPYLDDGPRVSELPEPRALKALPAVKGGRSSGIFPLSDAQTLALRSAVAQRYPKLDAIWAAPEVGAEGARPERGGLPVYERCIYHILHTDLLERFVEHGGGTTEIRGSWATAEKFLNKARAEGKHVLALFDHAENFRQIDHAAEIVRVVVEKQGANKFTSTVTFANFQKLEKKYLFSKLVKLSDGLRVHPAYQRGALPCLTPKPWLARGLTPCSPIAPESPVVRGSPVLGATVRAPSPPEAKPSNRRDAAEAVAPEHSPAAKVPERSARVVADTPLTIFRWGYEGWGSSVPQLLQVTAAVEKARGFEPPVFVDIRFSRSVRAAGFREKAFEKTLGPDRYVWMQSLGNAAIGRHDGSIEIHDPKGAETLLDRAIELQATRRRAVFFCSCGPPVHCHRNEVTHLLLKSAKRRRVSIEVVEWPGGKPSTEPVASVKVTRPILNEILRGRAAIPLGDDDDVEVLAGLPVGAIVVVSDDARSVSVSVGPAVYRAGGWSMPIFIQPVAIDDDVSVLYLHVMRVRTELRFEVVR